MEKIQNLSAQEILDSRGNPTLEVTVFTEKSQGRFAVPAGVSTGQNEAHELRDKDPARFKGLGVKKAIQRLQKHIVPALKGTPVTNQKEIDATLKETDGTENKSFLGGNTTIGVSIAAAKAAAQSQGLPLSEYLKTLANIKPSRPVPFLYINLIEGGQHASTALAFQEYHLVPQTDDIETALLMAHQIQSALKTLLEKELGLGSVNAGDEGGVVPNIADVSTPLELLKRAAQKTSHLNQVKFSLDVAASSFYQGGAYQLAGQPLKPTEFFELYKPLIKDYPIISIEDPLEQNDFESFAKLRRVISPVKVVGDDLTVTNPKLLQKALELESIDAIIIKPNQIGTLSETLETMRLARENNLECIVSHRGGETNDSFIADLALAFGCFGIKAGGLQRGERLAKYNRLWRLTNGE